MTFQLPHYMFSEGSYNSSGSYSSGAFVELTIWSARKSFGSGTGGCWNTADRFRPMASLCSCSSHKYTWDQGCVIDNKHHAWWISDISNAHCERPGWRDRPLLPVVHRNNCFFCMVQCASLPGLVSIATGACSNAMHNDDVPSIAQASILMIHNRNWMNSVAAFALASAR